MLSCTRDMVIPSVSQAKSILESNLDMRPIYIDLDKVLMNIFSMNTQIDKYNKAFEKITGVPYSRKSFLGYIVQNNMAGYFSRTATGQLSANEESINAALNSEMPELYKEFTELYVKISKLVSARGDLIPLLQNPISDLASCDGHRMLECRPVWQVQNTGRLGMAKPAIQNINRGLQDLITAPYGYKLIHTDSGQVEPRIVYSAFIKDPQIKALIELYDDAYFGLLHYCTMPKSYIDSGTLNFTKMEITDSMKAGRKKIKTYGNAVMYGSKKIEDNIKEAMTERIGRHPSRLQLIAEIEDKLNRGITIFETYFGTKINIINSNKLNEYQGQARREAMIRLAINNPIQGTAADLMRYSVQQANRIILGTKHSSIACYIHDAGIFYVEEDEFDKVHRDLEDIVAYQVDDWIPVHSEAEIYEFNPKGEFVTYGY